MGLCRATVSGAVPGEDTDAADREETVTKLAVTGEEEIRRWRNDLSEMW